MSLQGTLNLLNFLNRLAHPTYIIFWRRKDVTDINIEHDQTEQMCKLIWLYTSGNSSSQASTGLQEVMIKLMICSCVIKPIVLTRKLIK